MYITFVNKLKRMIDRIKSLMTHYQLSAAQFADKIGVQRSALSHVLSGRNRPSLDFVIKIKSEFPEVNLEWITLGKGSMIQGDVVDTGDNTVDLEDTRSLFDPQDRLKTTEMEKENDPHGLSVKGAEAAPGAVKVLKEIVLFYTDGTFERFVQKQA